MRLYEKHRPRTLDGVVGQDKAVRQVRRIIERGDVGGQTFWFSGQTGVGKTTLAKILARSIADDWFITEYVGRKLTPRGLDAIERDAQLYSLGKGGRAFIINESHGLSAPVIEQLLDFLERLPQHTCVIFTTSKDGQGALFDAQIDAEPLLGRCVEIKLTNQGTHPAFAKLARTIAQSEGLDGRPESAYRRLAADCHGNLRKMLQRIGNGEMADDR